MDYFSLINSTKEAELAYANWYSQLPDERKARMLADLYQFGVDSVKYNAQKENPFLTEAEQLLRYLELNIKDSCTEEIWNFIRQSMEKRAEQEWQERFKAMKKTLGWTYEDMAKYMGAGSGNAIKSSVSRKLPAFARLAVCVFEQLQKQQKEDNLL